MAHVAPFGAHLAQLGDALPVASVGDVVAEDEHEAHQVGEDRVRVRVREDVVEEVLRDRLLDNRITSKTLRYPVTGHVGVLISSSDVARLDDERERHTHQGRDHRTRDGGASDLVE